MKQGLKQLEIEAKNEIAAAQDLKKLDEVFKKYLGKKGEIAEVFVSLKNLPEKKRKQVGKEANSVKKEIEGLIESKLKVLKREQRDLKVKKEKIDITRPGKKVETGRLHPITLIRREAEGIFQSMGFEIVQGPEVENEWYNFDALNFPKEHPARDMQDTFWLKRDTNIRMHTNDTNKLLLRTHTSPVQIRYMETHQPPLRIVVPGRVFRNEATDASHEAQFYQLEGLMVDRDISAAHFKAISTEFLKRLFKTDVEIRLRPGFFPFTEPSFEVDAKRKEGDWLELMGAGMVHPNVFKAAGLNPNDWQGFAFGMGLGRLAMIKYKIGDIRSFYQSDLRFLKQF